MEKIKVVQYGLGPIGIEAAKLVLRKKDMQLVGVVDIAPEKKGKTLGEILNRNGLGIKVVDNIKELFSRVKADVVIHATGSSLRKVYPQLSEILSQGVNIVSSCEELLFPNLKNRHLARELDILAKKEKATVLGTGVNPGFVMDYLPLTLTAVCQKIERIEVKRVVDAATRRLPLQRKIGVGITPEEFKKRVRQKRIGHIGLKESLALVADSLKWKLTEIKEILEPMTARKKLETAYFKVQAGKVTGIKQLARGFVNGKEIIKLDLRMYAGAEKPGDTIFIKGVPRIKLKIEGGIAGDFATVAMLVNAAPHVIAFCPGLITMKDLGLSYCK